MVTVAEVDVDADSFPLGNVIENIPAARVILERVVPTDTGVVPYFWVQGVAAEDLLAVFGDHPQVESTAVVDSVDEDEHLVRVVWTQEAHGIVWALAEHEITLLSGTGYEGRWRFQIRSENQGAISSFMKTCREENIGVHLLGLHSLDTGASVTPTDLTDAQREALLLAFERGYFETPRRASLEDLADDLDISRQAFSSRLRRALHRVVANELSSSHN